ncbi:glycosyltransferase family 1 protein [Micromonospora sp. HSS6-12]|uniref:Glycosyltransferase family 1 protein n=1 Tax=Micromonospora thermarum TaxID=2720024 RepID=A0ABX0Z6U8_9ACTN|nr:glycosyltransferase family 1 protein [Micromonospora thermarum]
MTASVPEQARLGDVPVANVLMLGTAEWDSPIATNQHYVARELARTSKVTFVESLGLRRPKLRRDDVVRMASRVRRALGDREEAPAQRPRPAGAEIVSPLVLPVHRTPTFPINRALLRRATSDWLASPRPRVLWTFTPVTYGLEASADVVIYHCVDLLATFPGVDGVAVGRGERSLSSRTAVAIATSKAVQDHLADAGFPRIELLPNVADVSVFTAASRPAGERRPAVLFSGNLTVYKLDMRILESIATALRGRGELLLAGPLAAGGGSFDAELRRLEELGARHLGVLTPAQLAEVAGTCAAGLIPYEINDYTLGVSPLKCFEYLSSGLAVLSTGLPSVTELARANSHVTVAGGDDFAARLVDLLQPVTDTVVTDRMASAAEHGWEGRGVLLRTLLETELARRR